MLCNVIVVMVSFTESEYNETEGAGSMRIGVQLSRILQQMITIQVATTGIIAEGFHFLHYCYNLVLVNIINRKWNRF